MKVSDYLEAVYEAFQNVDLRPISIRRPQSPIRPSVISVVRDELHLMAEFLDHYRAAGVASFFIIDNGSTDGTLEYLTKQPDVTVYQTHDRFDWRAKQGWINLAMVMQGIPNWFIYADADEKIVYDGYPHKTFPDLCREMDRQGIRRVRGMLVDMYGAHPVANPSRSEQTLAEYAPFFDASGYKEEKYELIISRKGGPRRRAFAAVDPKFNPELTKYPLFKLRPGEMFVNPHNHWPIEDNFVSPCYLGILHYKFTPHFGAKMRRAIAEKTYWDASHEYRCYAARLEQEPDLSLFDAAISRRYGHPKDLIEANIITTMI